MTHPTALVDPVAEPPVAEGGTSHIQNKQDQDQQAGGGASARLYVNTKHRPGHAPKLLLLPFSRTTTQVVEHNQTNGGQFVGSMFGQRYRLPLSLTTGVFFFTDPGLLSAGFL